MVCLTRTALKGRCWQCVLVKQLAKMDNRKLAHLTRTNPHRVCGTVLGWLLVCSEGFSPPLALREGFSPPLALREGFSPPLALREGFSPPLALREGFSPLYYVLTTSLPFRAH